MFATAQLGANVPKAWDWRSASPPVVTAVGNQGNVSLIYNVPVSIFEYQI